MSTAMTGVAVSALSATAIEYLSLVTKSNIDIYWQVDLAIASPLCEMWLT